MDETRTAIIENLQKYILNDSAEVHSVCKASDADVVSSTPMDSEDHDVNVCHCHVPQNLQYAVNLIENKETLVPLIKKLYEGGILDDFLLMFQLISKGDLNADNVPLLKSLKAPLSL